MPYRDMDAPTDRLIDQRLRNRIIEAVHILSKGDEGVRQVWPDEYFESFYDFIPHRDDGEMQQNSAMTIEERTALLEVRDILDTACDATPQQMEAEEFIATGWPSKVQPIARNALSLMLRRGRFDEKAEEIEPSFKGKWP